MGLLPCACGPHVPLARYDFWCAFHVMLSSLADLHIHNGTRSVRYVPLSILGATLSVFVSTLNLSQGLTRVGGVQAVNDILRPQGIRVFYLNAERYARQPTYTILWVNQNRN